MSEFFVLNDGRHGFLGEGETMHECAGKIRLDGPNYINTDGGEVYLLDAGIEENLVTPIKETDLPGLLIGERKARYIRIYPHGSVIVMFPYMVWGIRENKRYFPLLTEGFPGLEPDDR